MQPNNGNSLKAYSVLIKDGIMVITGKYFLREGGGGDKS